MKSLFAKNFLIYAVVIVLGFAILGSSFIYQVNRFAIEEKQKLLSETENRAVQTTATLYTSRRSTAWREEFTRIYLVNMRQLASDCDGVIYVGDAGGNLAFIATGVNCYIQENGVLPPLAVRSVLDTGSYMERSDFYGYLSEEYYITGASVPNVSGGVDAVVFVAVPASSATTLYHQLSGTFILLTTVVLALTLLATVIVVRGTVRPLKQIAEAARSFGRGDYSARVALPERQDELYDLAASFNSMASSMENVEMTRRGLIASVSHDIRTPMTTIAGFVDGILDGTIKPERQEHYLRIISDEVKRLARLANSMLTVSRLETGGVQNRTVFDMSEMIRRIIISFEQAFTQKQIDVQLEIPEKQDLNADHDSIFQAVYNLVDNAVKFVNPGGKITILLSERSGRLQFTIRNTGGEIPEEILPHVFERFYKGDASRTGSGKGSGLGLYIVKTVINQHGGDVFAKSEDGETEFRFSVPEDSGK
ncbi:MAG: HAMP domain-containing sensor histidine kinase [Clostridiaceae bacterium]|nr:HAMP domain-containing sensor histidine kinase [Clostridiaceae bacterium]